MATLHKEYNNFNNNIKLTTTKKEQLEKSRNKIRKRIKDWFSENKPNELQPKFHGQGSYEMNTGVNPIPEYDDEGNIIHKYDLDYGVYFIEKENEDNKRDINTWHNWVYESVKDYTSILPTKKNTCIRVNFTNGKNIDLPIYYKDSDLIELAHKSKGWIESDPKAFYEWFNNEVKENQQIRRIVRFLKAWKNFRETENTTLNLPSGFALTILAVNNFKPDDNDDKAFRDTIIQIKFELDKEFKCLRPTTPKNEDVFNDFSDTMKDNFLNNLGKLIKACEKADEEKNFKIASEYMRKEFGNRFPLGKDEDEETKNSRLKQSLGAAIIKPKPFGI